MSSLVRIFLFVSGLTLHVSPLQRCLLPSFHFICYGPHFRSRWVPLGGSGASFSITGNVFLSLGFLFNSEKKHESLKIRKFQRTSLRGSKLRFGGSMGRLNTPISFVVCECGDLKRQSRVPELFLWTESQVARSAMTRSPFPFLSKAQGAFSAVNLTRNQGEPHVVTTPFSLACATPPPFRGHPPARIVPSSAVAAKMHSYVSGGLFSGSTPESPRRTRGTCLDAEEFCGAKKKRS